MVAKGCRVLSFDPLCCGGAHRMGPSHDFIPVGLHTYDGLADSDDPARPNTTFPVLSLRTISAHRRVASRAALQALAHAARHTQRVPPLPAVRAMHASRP
jgi:hypothetical protein